MGDADSAQAAAVAEVLAAVTNDPIVKEEEKGDDNNQQNVNNITPRQDDCVVTTVAPLASEAKVIADNPIHLEEASAEISKQDSSNVNTITDEVVSEASYGSPTNEPVEPTTRDVVLGPGVSGLVMNDLVHDMIRLEALLWRLKYLPVPDSVTQEVKDTCDKFIKVVKFGKPLELAGLKDVPHPFLRSQGRFLLRSEDSGLFFVMADELVSEILCGLFMDELRKDSPAKFATTPYKELKDIIIQTRDTTTTIDTTSIVMVPDPKDAILLRRGASNADKLYESHMGNKIVFSLISQLVTTQTTSSEARVEAALFLLQGLHDATHVPTHGGSDAPSEDGSGIPAPTQVGTISGRKARFLLRNIREDESVFWSVLNPSDSALFAICFVFEVYLEKEIHLQHPQKPSIVLKDTTPALVEHSTTVPVESPTDYDVLFGRGGMTNAHPGNRRFRDVIALHRPDYIRALKMDKPTVARKIVKAIRRMGRFMKKAEDGKWYDVGDRTAAEKTSQGLRERTNAEKRQRSALREALRIRRQDRTDSTSEGADESKKHETTKDKSRKKQKTAHPNIPVVTPHISMNPHVSILNYVGTNMAVPLSLGMKGPSAASPSPVVKRDKCVASAASVSGAGDSQHEQLFTEGLPPNAVDEDGNILVTDYDILCGRGGLTNHHKGNKRFRDIVALHRPDYVRAPKIQKPSVARVIVRAIRNGDPPGRFIRKCEKTGKWIDIGDKKAAEKTSQALREKTSDERDKLRRDIESLGGRAPLNVLLPNPVTFLNPDVGPAFPVAKVALPPFREVNKPEADGTEMEKKINGPPIKQNEAPTPMETGPAYVAASKTGTPVSTMEQKQIAVEPAVWGPLGAGVPPKQHQADEKASAKVIIEEVNKYSSAPATENPDVGVKNPSSELATVQGVVGMEKVKYPSSGLAPLKANVTMEEVRYPSSQLAPVKADVAVEEVKYPTSELVSDRGDVAAKYTKDPSGEAVTRKEMADDQSPEKTDAMLLEAFVL